MQYKNGIQTRCTLKVYILQKRKLLKNTRKLIKIKSVLLGIHANKMQFYNIKLSREKFCICKKKFNFKKFKK